MAINPAALLPSGMSRCAPSHNAQPQPVIADLDQPAHVQPLHSVVKVQLNCSEHFCGICFLCWPQHYWPVSK